MPGSLGLIGTNPTVREGIRRRLWYSREAGTACPPRMSSEGATRHTRVERPPPADSTAALRLFCSISPSDSAPQIGPEVSGNRLPATSRFVATLPPTRIAGGSQEAVQRARGLLASRARLPSAKALGRRPVGNR